MKSVCFAMLLLAATSASGCSKGHFTASLKSLKMKRVYLGIDPKFNQIVSRLDFELSDDAESCAIARDELRVDIDDLPLTVTGNGGPGGSGLLTGKPDICLQFLFETKWPMGTVAGWPNGELLYKPPGLISTLTIRDDSQTISMRMLDLFRAPPENVVSIVSPANGVLRSGGKATFSLSKEAADRFDRVSVFFGDPAVDLALSPFARLVPTSDGLIEVTVPPSEPKADSMNFYGFVGPRVLSCENADCVRDSYALPIGTIPIEVVP
jgi:hypothetical protein